VTDAVPPTCTNFLKLNSRPREKRRKITPISDHTLTPSESTTVGKSETWGLTKKPAMIYPNTTG
jgi:hypothetical protein